MSYAVNMDSKSRRTVSSTTSPTASVIVPAYRENANLRSLVTRLFTAFESHPDSIELIIVDDNSRDGSVETVETLCAEGYNVRIIVRTTERGLSSAVIRGFQEAKGSKLICMDADLQHPPESVPFLISALSDSPFVLATRYAQGVEMDKDWPVYRRIISNGARYLAKPLTSASDPMSGFFGITKSRFQQAGSINSQGFKIALDLLVKANIPKKGIAEVAFSFGLRQEGESKLDSKVMIKYLQQLKELYIYKFGGLQLVLFFLLLLIVTLYLWIAFVSPALFG